MYLEKAAEITFVQKMMMKLTAALKILELKTVSQTIFSITNFVQINEKRESSLTWLKKSQDASAALRHSKTKEKKVFLIIIIIWLLTNIFETAWKAQPLYYNFEVSGI